MLTADLVRVKKSGNRLSVVPLTDRTRPRAVELAERYTALVQANQGATYAELKEAFAGVDLQPRDKKLASGLQKLIEDQLELDAESRIDPRKLRSELFLAAAQARRAAPHVFDPDAAFRSARAALGLSETTELGELKDALYADLKSQHRIRRVPDLSASRLLERYDVAQYQAVLLRATRVLARVQCDDAARYRDLFRALKFRRLLHRILEDGDGYRIEIDGPFSLFESVTKYGLQLALVFPQLTACDRLELSAELRWGKERTALQFEYQSQRPSGAPAEDRQPQEVRDLVERFRALGSGFEVHVNDAIVNLPGVGVIVPDLVFTRDDQKIYFELLGFWSRDAVWKRVELVERGLPHNVLFAVSSRLRVSEEVLEHDGHAALYVFKGVMSPKRIVEKLARLV